MRKTFEQILLEAQVTECSTMEELFLLWQLMQQMEECPEGRTGYREIDRRTFHIDGIVSEKDFSGTLYIMKETSMRKQIRKEQTLPVISDVRRQLQNGRSPFGEVEYMEYLAGMERILCDGKETDPLSLLRRTAVLYLNKRGGKGAADDISMQYGQYYMAFIRRQIQMIRPSVVVCCGEEIFRLVVMEVFHNKRKKKNREEYMKWKNVVEGDIFYADESYRHAAGKNAAEVAVVNMWNPAYRVNNGRYVSLEEYLREFSARVETLKKAESSRTP